MRSSGEEAGVVRLRYQPETGYLISHFKPVSEMEWGVEITASRNNPFEWPGLRLLTEKEAGKFSALGLIYKPMEGCEATMPVHQQSEVDCVVLRDQAGDTMIVKLSSSIDVWTLHAR